jgi:hypothetical protein
MGSYEVWAEVVGGILDTAGIEGFLENREAFAAQADVETAQWGRLVEAWWVAWGEAGVDTATLFPLAEPLIPEVLGDGNERSQRIRLGKALRKRLDWNFRLPATRDRPERVVSLQATEVTDSEGRKRNAWALVGGAQGDAQNAQGNHLQHWDIGGNSENDNDIIDLNLPRSEISNIGGHWDIGEKQPGFPNVGNSPNVDQTTLVEGQPTDIVDVFENSPNVPMSQCPQRSATCNATNGGPPLSVPDDEVLDL